MAELVKFQRKTDSEIDATPVTDGLLMFSTTTGSGRIAMDYAGVRNEMGGNDITVDSVLSLVSENPVQNKVITEAITEEINSINDDITTVENTYTQSFPSCETYSESATYAINDYVIYSSALYRCVVAIPVAEAWNADHWASINSTNIGLIYNTTDSSFYGRSGADSVLKKLNKTIKKYTFLSSELHGTQTVTFNIKSISGYADLTSTQMSSGIQLARVDVVNSTFQSIYYVNQPTYNPSTGIASVLLTTEYSSLKLQVQLILNVFVAE